MSVLSNVEQTLLALLRCSLLPHSAAADDLPALSEREWQSLAVRADALGVTSLTLNGALRAEADLPENILAVWRALDALRRANAEEILEEQDKCLRALIDARISAAVIGHGALATHYPAVIRRDVRSFMILTEPNAKAVLAPIVLKTKHQFFFDLPIPASLDRLAAVRLRSLLARALDSTEPATLEGYCFQIPNRNVKELLLLVAATREITLSLLADWTTLIEYNEDTRDKGTSRVMREKCGLADTAARLSFAAARAFGLDVSDTDCENAVDTDAILRAALTPQKDALAESDALFKQLLDERAAKARAAKTVKAETAKAAKAAQTPRASAGKKNPTAPRQNAKPPKSAQLSKSVQPSKKKKKPEGTLSRLLDGLFPAAKRKKSDAKKQGKQRKANGQ